MNKASAFKRSTATCAALLAAAFVGAVPAQQDETADAADEPTGPRNCLNQADIRKATILSNRNIVFVTRFETIYSNQLAKQCPGLQRNSMVNYRFTNRRLCEGDRFQVLHEQGLGNYVPAAMCPLGTFVQITEAELEDLTTMTDEQRAKRPRGRSSRQVVTTEQVEPPPPTPPATPPAGGEPAPNQ